MFYLLGLVIIAGLVGGFAATASMAIVRYRPATSARRRRTIASLVGSAMTLSPALVSSAQAGLAAFVAVAVVGVPLFAAVFGYPAVRFFEPGRPKQD